MDCFGLFLDALCLAGQGVMHISFAARLTGKERKIRYFASYGLILAVIQAVSVRLALHETLSIGAGVLALYAVSRFALGNQRPASWLAAVLAFYVSQLSFGIVNSLEAAAFPRFVGSPLLYPLLLAAQALFFALCVCCYRAVGKLLAWTEDSRTPRLGLLLFPGLFFFAAELYILRTAYHVAVPSASLEEVGRHATMLLLQIMGLAALLCTLYAYRQFCQGFQAQAALQSLTQAAQAQKVYITEAQLRYERTKSYFDDPERAEKGAEGPERKNGGGEERCAGSTDEVDREIERLKKKKEDLERRLSTETDEARIKDLERRLAQTERELREKDNDAYRRRHTRFTKLS